MQEARSLFDGSLQTLPDRLKQLRAGWRKKVMERGIFRWDGRISDHYIVTAMDRMSFVST